MFGSGASAYSKVGLETDVLNADPHRLVLILFDGALKCIHRAQGSLASKDVAQRSRHLTKAVQIVDEGLRVAVDPGADPAFAARLVSLYQYVIMKLLQANLRGDAAALEEAAKILGELRAAWVKIAPGAGAVAAADPGSGNAAAETVATPNRRALHAYQV